MWVNPKCWPMVQETFKRASENYKKKFKIRNQKSRREREKISSSSYVLVNKTVMFQFEIYFSNLT